MNCLNGGQNKPDMMNCEREIKNVSTSLKSAAEDNLEEVLVLNRMKYLLQL